MSILSSTCAGTSRAWPCEGGEGCGNRVPFSGEAATVSLPPSPLLLSLSLCGCSPPLPLAASLQGRQFPGLATKHVKGAVQNLA